MARKSFAKILKDQGYQKLYQKRCMSLLNANFMHLLLMPKDIASVTIIAYEKISDNGMVVSDIILQRAKMRNANVELRYMSFFLRKKIEDDDLRPTVAKMLNEQMDIEEELEDLEFMKLQ